jgi:hypothetical protein
MIAAGGRSKRAVVQQDALMKGAQCRAGLESERVDQLTPDGPVDLQRVGLPSGAVEREHQQLVQSLPPRLSRGLRTQRRHGRGGAAARELCLGEQLEDPQSALLERRRLAGQRRMRREFRERRAAPQCQCRPGRFGRSRGIATLVRRARRRPERPEAARVDSVLVERDPVAAGGSHDEVTVAVELTQGAPQPPDMRLQRVRGAGRRVLRPKGVDQRLARDRLLGVQ